MSARSWQRSVNRIMVVASVAGVSAAAYQLVEGAPEPALPGARLEADETLSPDLTDPEEPAPTRHPAATRVPHVVGAGTGGSHTMETSTEPSPHPGRWLEAP
jgi:hypothetical protein